MDISLRGLFMLLRHQTEKRGFTSGLAIIFLSILGSSALGQTPNPVSLAGKLEPGQVKQGQSAKILITAKIDPGWHLYSLTQGPGGPIATTITIDENSPFQMDGKPRQPKPKKAVDPNFTLPGRPDFITETFDNEVTFTVPVKAAANSPPGALKTIVKVRFQVCDDHQCLPPRTRPVEVDATIIAANTAPSPGQPNIAVISPSPPPSSTPAASPSPANPSATGVSAGPNRPPAAIDAADEETAQNLRGRGLFGYILFAMGVGLLSLLTPCVFPMIPITVSFFTKREQRTTGEAVKQALIYCFGIIFTFTGLGMALTLIAGPSGINKLAANPWMNLFLTTLFVVFALNLFGMFEIRLPSGFISKLDTRSQSGTVAATLLMGLTFTLTSFTCTAAFVGTVLVAVTQGEWFWPAIGMLAFSTAFAFPFFLLALFPKWMQSLPKSGGWLNSVKVVMGFLELGAAFKFLSNVDLVWGWETVSRNLVLAGWIAIAIVTSIYLLGKFQLPHDTPVQKIGVMRMLTATSFLGLAFFFLTGLFGGNLGEWEAMLPPTPQANPGGLATTGNSHGAWLVSYDEALQKARLENKAVFLNFTGVTCTNCRWMESNMFTKPEVKKELERFVLAELFTDRETAEDERNGQLQAEKFETVALPLYAIVDSNGNTLAKFAGLTRDRQEFIGFLQSGANKFQQIAAKRVVSSSDSR
jgi:thiol:disulfide interchange protein